MSAHSTQTDAIVAINMNEESELRVYGVDKCKQIGSYDYKEINQSTNPRTFDCPLSTEMSTEISTIFDYTIVGITSAILLISFSTCIIVIVGFTASIRRAS